jgi:hypothetical protein
MPTAGSSFGPHHFQVRTSMRNTMRRTATWAMVSWNGGVQSPILPSTMGRRRAWV